jgi:hypothetical protein
MVKISSIIAYMIRMTTTLKATEKTLKIFHILITRLLELKEPKITQNDRNQLIIKYKLISIFKRLCSKIFQNKEIVFFFLFFNIN